MTIQDSFTVNVANGDQLDDGYFNSVSLYVAGTVSPNGHTHNGSDSRAIGWVTQEVKKIAAGDNLATYTFNNLPNKKMWKLTYRLLANFANSTNDFIGLRINGDTASNYNYGYINNVNTVDMTNADSYVLVGSIYGTVGEQCGTIGEALIPNLQADALVDKTPVNVNAFGGADPVKPLGGFWNSNATITSLTILNISSSSRYFKGELVLQYFSDME